MPALTKTTEAIRINQSLQVLSLMAQGRSQTEACEIAKISPAQFRYWLGKEEPAIEAMRDLTVELERASLAAVITARGNIITRIADIVATTPLPANDLITIDKHLGTLQKELEEKYGTQSQDKDAAKFLELSGPALNRPDSIFSAKVTQTTLEITSETRPPEGEIIDAEFTEEEDD